MTVDHDAAVHEVLANGYCVIRPDFPAAFLDAVSTEIERLVARGFPVPRSAFAGFKTLRYFGLLEEGEIWQQVATQPDVLNITRRVLGSNFLLSLLSTALIDSGETAQTLHTDDDVYEMPRPHDPIVLNTIWALTDFTDLNGATRVKSKSHLLTGLPKGHEHDETIPIEMRRGEVALILGTTHHGGGANQTGERRDGLIVNYCNGIFRQHESILLGLPATTIAGFSRTLKALVGCYPTHTGLGLSNPGITRFLR